MIVKEEGSVVSMRTRIDFMDTGSNLIFYLRKINADCYG